MNNKPKCTSKSQSCGSACIERHKVCRQKLTNAGNLAAQMLLLRYATAAQELASPLKRLELTFEQLQTKFPTEGKQGIQTSTHTQTATESGGVLHTLSQKAADSSGDLLNWQMLELNGQSYSISDGVVKEITNSRKGSNWQEAHFAALRCAAVSRTADSALIRDEDLSKKLGHDLGQGFNGSVHLKQGDETRVIKVGLPSQIEYATMTLTEEAYIQHAASQTGVAPKVYAVAHDAFEAERIEGKRPDWKQMEAVYDTLVDKLHRAGIAHNDIKPDNAKIRPDGSVCILDYGLAKLDDGGMYGCLAEFRGLNQFPTPRMRQIAAMNPQTLTEYQACIAKVYK
jgi:predicted Ser/Thr protein kinase